MKPTKPMHLSAGGQAITIGKKRARLIEDYILAPESKDNMVDFYEFCSFLEFAERCYKEAADRLKQQTLTEFAQPFIAAEHNPEVAETYTFIHNLGANRALFTQIVGTDSRLSTYTRLSPQTCLAYLNHHQALFLIGGERVALSQEEAKQAWRNIDKNCGLSTAQILAIGIMRHCYKTWLQGKEFRLPSAARLRNPSWPNSSATASNPPGKVIPPVLSIRAIVSA